MPRTLRSRACRSQRHDVVLPVHLAALAELQEAAGTVAECLLQKGFCVAELQPKNVLPEQVVQDGCMLEDRNQLVVPPMEIVDGLLGAQGSTMICEFESLADRLPGLAAAEDFLLAVGRLCGPQLESCLGLPSLQCSRAVLHQSGSLPEPSAPLTDDACDRWLRVLMDARVMAVLFAGPREGTLVMHPIRSEDSLPFEIQLQAGMVVLLRPDVLVHRLFEGPGWGPCFAVSCLLHERALKPQLLAPEDSVTPAVWGLLEWSRARIQVLQAKAEQGAQLPVPGSIPRDWELAMKDTRCKADQVPIQSATCHFPGTDPDFDPCGQFWSCINNSGADLAMPVPRQRWDLEQWYDPDPQSHTRWKSYAKHGVFIDNVGAFDNKMFGISRQEAQGMDPSQKLFLEVGYMALVQAGYNKRKLQMAFIGVYVGQGQVEMPAVESTMGGTGGSRAVACGRISYCLGMQGPCCALECDGATSLACLENGFHRIRNQEKMHMQHKERTVKTALVGASALTFDPTNFVKACSAGWLSSKGRCFTFDQSASGYVKSEGCGFACLGAAAAEDAAAEDAGAAGQEVGRLAAVELGNCGFAASMRAPTGPAEQRLVLEALRQAALSPMHVEAVECFGDGSPLGDAVEAGNLQRCFRSTEPQGRPLHVGAAMTQAGFMRETAGFAQLVKLLEGMRYGLNAPNIHLHQRSAHLEQATLQQLCIPVESMPRQLPRSFVGAGCRGLGGTLAHAIVVGEVRGELDAAHCRPFSQTARDAIVFWPGGGGEVQEGADPEQGYCIVGSWSQWLLPEPMHSEEDGDYSCIVTLGENCFEHFQVWIDGDSQRVLHPGMGDAPKGAPVYGPDHAPEVSSASWLIDGRWDRLPPRAEGEEAIRDPAGDLYLVRFSMMGGWRSVMWEPLGQADKRGRPFGQGHYYLAGTWNGWELDEMVPDGEHANTFLLDVELLRPGVHEFQVVRNRDWNQAFHPQERGAWSGSSLVGPDGAGDGLFWLLDARAGQTFRFRFSRDRKPGVDRCSIDWWPLR